MDTRGYEAPRTESAARAHYEDLAGAAQTITKEVADAGTDSSEAYQEFIDQSVIETAQQALFGSLLEVHVGSQTEYDTWLAEHESFDATLAGTETVPSRAWHPVWPTEQVVAVSFQDRPDAAVATVRRQAFGQHYRSMLGLE